jgi:hypothetical protein
MRKHESTKSIKIHDNQSKQINSSIWSLANQLVEVIPLAVPRLGHYWVLDCSRIRHVRSWESITKLRLFHVFPCHPGILATPSPSVPVGGCSLCPPFQSISVLFLAINPHDSTEGAPNSAFPFWSQWRSEIIQTWRACCTWNPARNQSHSSHLWNHCGDSDTI